MRIPITLTATSEQLLAQILAQSPHAVRTRVLAAATEIGLRDLQQQHRASQGRGGENNVYLERIEELESFALQRGLPTLGRTLALRGPAAAERDLAVLEQAHAAKILTAATADATIAQPEPWPPLELPIEDPPTDDERLESLVATLSPDEELIENPFLAL